MNPAITTTSTTRWMTIILLGSLVLVGCGEQESGAPASAPEAAPEPVAETAPEVPEGAAELARRARTTLGVLPGFVPNEANARTDAKVDLGRMLYFDARLSKNQDVSCNSCHMLDAFGVDGEPTSPGHKGQRGDRNSPTVYNAALHIAQFWDGRAPDVEAQAGGPVLNPIEMAMPSEEAVLTLLGSIPGYVEAFAAAYPGDDTAITYQNMTLAIGVFERALLTPGRFDAFLGGDLNALTEQERKGLDTFLSVGCNSCHNGPAVGGTLYRKLGFIFPYETEDVGRENVTGNEIDRHVFKVPSLRNVAETGPYLHDGSIASLPEMVRIMGKHQIGIDLSDEQVADIVVFLEALTGNVDTAYVAKPELPESGPDTPAPDPS
ncbi:MAG: c-type cytochrome [bacterium]|nr:c-type cytochrome [bacterium]